MLEWFTQEICRMLSTETVSSSAASTFVARGYKKVHESRRNVVAGPCRSIHCCLFLFLSGSSTKMLKNLIVLQAISAALVLAQNASAVVSTSPAAETLAANVTPANLPLFDTEAVQLTDRVVAALREHNEYAEYASLFDFGDSLESTPSARTRRARRSPRCKTMPGDALYPSKSGWSVFNALLGGALQKIIPIGSPCYKQSQYNNYDAARCAELVKNFDAEEI